jgi:hypothetical protein
MLMIRIRTLGIISMSTTLSPPLTISGVGKHFGLPTWKIRRVFYDGLVPEPRRLHYWRIIFPEELPAIEAALVRLGYLPRQEGGPDAA